MSHNEPELDRLEAALRAVRPRHRPLLSSPAEAGARPAPAATRAQLTAVLRWGREFRPGLAGRLLIPATAWSSPASWPGGASRPPPAETGTLRADNVQINQDLVSTFDTVEPLPNGEPVRYRCASGWIPSWSGTAGRVSKWRGCPASRSYRSVLRRTERISDEPRAGRPDICHPTRPTGGRGGEGTGRERPAEERREEPKTEP